ncbi:hypothetical protein [Glaciihabitans sp. UYNi722]|uniref:hypothetical protein n=1 Tax=Glaciihabitans sp. UYNi722 TaxID=3156344 RepID=UPI003396C917
MAAQRTSKRLQLIPIVGAAVLLAALALSGCSAQSATTPAKPTSGAPAPHATEVSPSGDIPDNQAYVPFTDPTGAFSVTVPEGWAQSTADGATVFADKLNIIALRSATSATAPTVASATQNEVAALKSSGGNFSLKKVAAFTRPGGSGVLITFQSDSAVNQVTGSVVRNDVEQYLFWKAGTRVTVTLTSPQGSDNVDPWAKVTGSFVWLTK